MANQPDSTSTSVKDLLNLATRLRTHADKCMGRRDVADDMRQAADLASRWATTLKDGWENVDYSHAALMRASDNITLAEAEGRSTCCFMAWTCRRSPTNRSHIGFRGGPDMVARVRPELPIEVLPPTTISDDATGIVSLEISQACLVAYGRLFEVIVIDVTTEVQP